MSFILINFIMMKFTPTAVVVVVIAVKTPPPHFKGEEKKISPSKLYLVRRLDARIIPALAPAAVVVIIIVQHGGGNRYARTEYPQMIAETKNTVL